MPRLPRRASNSSFYHVMSQGINKEFIFYKETCMKKYKQLMLQKLEGVNIELLAYCIMTNHVHMLIYAEDCAELGKYMQKLNTSYSEFYNLRNERVGHVFRNRYNSQAIMDQRHLYRCLAYIHNNPVKAGMVRKPGDYMYSSYNDYIQNNGTISKNAIKLLFGTDYNYMDLFEMLHEQKSEEKFIDVNAKDAYSRDFDVLIKEFEEKYHVNLTLIKDKGLTKEFIKKARTEYDIPFTVLAEKLKMSISTVSRYENC